LARILIDLFSICCFALSSSDRANKSCFQTKTLVKVTDREFHWDINAIIERLVKWIDEGLRDCESPIQFLSLVTHMPVTLAEFKQRRTSLLINAYWFFKIASRHNLSRSAF
jgi:hypothetical protein